MCSWCDFSRCVSVFRFDDFAIHRVVYRHRSDCWGNLAPQMDRIISVVRISGQRNQQVLAILSQFSSAFPYFLMDMLVYCHPISGLILGLTSKFPSGGVDENGEYSTTEIPIDGGIGIGF